MIPKTIHYCWFGRNPLPPLALKCIESWKKYLPDFEIKEWNEDNFDVNSLPYTRDAYAAKKYAFVSDYVRMHVLHEHGGLYFDTDVEVIRPMDEIISKGSFMGIECISPTQGCMVAPGLCLGALPKLEVYRKILDIYHSISFLNADGSINMYAIVRITSDVLKEYGLRDENVYQFVGDISVYPDDYFNPLESSTGILKKTPNTHTIHWYTYSWGTPTQRFFLGIKKLIRRFFPFLK